MKVGEGCGAALIYKPYLKIYSDGIEGQAFIA